MEELETILTEYTTEEEEVTEISVIFDEDGYIEAFATIGGVEGGEPYPPIPDMDEGYFMCYKFTDRWEFDEERKTFVQNRMLLEELRAEREEECFSVINRGQAWYNTLTEEQTIELDTWYKAWLDVTETLIKPERPEWLV